MTLLPGHRYRVKRDTKPFKAGDTAVFQRRSLNTYDKGDTSDLYHFHNESTGSPAVLEHFGDHRSAKLEDIFEEITGS